MTGLSVKELSELRNLMSYNIDSQAAYYANSYHNTKRYLMDKRGVFPTGLVYIAKQYLESKPYQLQDSRVRPKAGELRDAKLSFQPYPEQKAAASSCFWEERGVVVAPTGTGKSAIIVLIISALRVRTLVVVPNLELKRQLTETLTEAYGSDQVGGLGAPIAVENIDALASKASLITSNKYDCVIVDEFHHAAADTYRKLNKKAWRGVYYRFGLTATPFRSNDNERLLLESFLSREIYRITYEQAVAAKYVVPVEAYYLDLTKTPVKGHTWAQVYKELVVDNKARNELIQGLLVSLHKAKIPTLCLVKEIKHGEAISAGAFPFVNGMDQDTKGLITAFNNKEFPVLVGTTGVIGEGVDSKPAEYVLITGLGRSKNAFMQACGRGMRKYESKESCKVIIFRDPSHKFTLRHFKAQVKILKEEYGCTPVKL